MPRLSVDLPQFRDPLTNQIAAFLESIGLPVDSRELAEPTIFPGMKLERGAVVIDESRLEYPGDLLHEAGHLAVLPIEERLAIDGDAGPSGGSEMGAMAWSYAAAVHLGLPPTVVFHEKAYKGWSPTLIEAFADRRWIGVPLLQAFGLTADDKNAAEMGISPFPAMLRWLR